MRGLVIGPAAAALLAGCLSIAGLDGDYVAGESASGAPAAGGATGTATSVSASGGAGQEDCLDGADDDGDGAADCADADCGAYHCVPAQRGALAYLTLEAASTDCLANEVAVLSSCDGCSCTANDGSCTIAVTYYISSDDCTGSTVAQSALSPCTNNATPPESIYLDAITPNGDGTCAAVAATVTATERSVCRAPGTGSCMQPGTVCVPQTANVAATACVLVDGDACGAAYPVTRGRVYEGAVADCACSCSVTDETCNPTLMWSEQNDCPGPLPNALALAPGCNALPTIDAAYLPPQKYAVTCETSGIARGAPQDVLLCCSA